MLGVMQAAQCSSLLSSQMRPGAGRKSLDINSWQHFLACSHFLLCIFASRHLARRRYTNFRGISFTNTLRIFGKLSGQLFCSGNKKLNAFGIVAQLSYAFEMLLKAKHDFEAP